MSDFMYDLSGVLGASQVEAVKEATHSTNKKSGSDLDMSDFLQLMVAMFQNQTMDNTVDTSEMMNQMVQMSVITAITNLSSQVTQSTNVSYAASLVGKEVTIAQGSGRDVKEITGTVTGTGMVNGEQVIFVGDKSYKLSDVMAVGRLPEKRD